MTKDKLKRIVCTAIVAGFCYKNYQFSIMLLFLFLLWVAAWMLVDILYPETDKKEGAENTDK